MGWTITQLTPADNSREISTKPTFTWSKTSDGSSEPRLRFIISKQSDLSSPIVDLYFPTETQYVYNGAELENDTDYYWAVFDEALAIPTSWKFTIKFAIPSLSSPALASTGISKRPTFIWSTTDGATQFDLQISEYADFSGTEGVDQWTISGIIATQYLLTFDLAYSTKYYWRVRATDGTTPGGWSVSGDYFTIEYGTPSSPVLVSPADNSTDIALNELFQWNDGGGADYFLLYIDESNAFPDPAIAKVIGTEYRVNDSIITYGKTYYWKVVAYNDSGNIDSAVFQFQTISAGVPNKPVLSSPQGSIDTNIPTFSWSPVTNTKYYHIQISTVNDFSSITDEDSSVTDISYTPSSVLAFDTIYYWRVRAYNDDYGGPWSDIMSFTTTDTTKGVLPGTPQWVYPSDGQQNVSINPTLDWSDTVNTDYWNLEVYDLLTGNLLFGTSILLASGSEFTLPSNLTLNYGTNYLAKVQSVNQWGSSPFVEVNFTTESNTGTDDRPKITYPADEETDVPFKFDLTWTFDDSLTDVPNPTYHVIITTNNDITPTTNQSSDDNIFLDIDGITEKKLSVELSVYKDYWVKIRAYYNGSYTNWSDIHHFVRKLYTPGKQTITNPLNNEVVKVPFIVVWSGSDDNVNYWIGEIYDDPGLAINNLVSYFTTPKQQKQYLIYDVPLNKNLYVRVRGDGFLNDLGVWSDVIIFKALKEPSAVSLIKPHDNEENVALTPEFVWSAADLADEYLLEISNGAEFNADDIVFSKAGLIGTSYTLDVGDSLDKSKEYYWRVRGKNNYGYGECSPFKFKTTASDSPLKPLLINPMAYSGGHNKEPVFVWSNGGISTAVKYEVQIATDSGFINLIYHSKEIQKENLDFAYKSNYSPIVDNNLDFYGQYYWRVRGISSSLTNGDWSESAYFSVMDIPAPLKVEVVSPLPGEDIPGDLTVSFDTPLYADEYQVQISKRASFDEDNIVYDNVIDTTSVVVSLDKGKYYIRVRANGRGGYGEYSEDLEFNIT